MEAGTHLVILDDGLCDETNAERLSDPTILNYYRQFLIQGFDCKNLVGQSAIAVQGLE